MSTINAFIKKHPVVCYYVLTFALSWGSVFAVVGGPDGFTPNAQEASRLLPLVVMALVSGPIVVGITMTALVDGKAGLRDFLARLLRWRVGASWYAAAVLTAPLAVLATQLALSPASANYLPGIFTADDKVGILLSGLAAGLAGGGFEEPGWTGFVTPRLKSRYGILGAGLIAGLLWGLWHFIVAVWGSSTPTGELSTLVIINQIAFYVGALPAYRVLMVWVYDRTESLLVAMLMHGCLTAVTTFIFAPSVTDEQRLIYHLAVSGTLWVVVGVVVAANRGRLSQRAPEAGSMKEAALYD